MRVKLLFIIIICCLVACQERAPTPVAEVATQEPETTEAVAPTETAVPPTPTSAPPTATTTPQPSAAPSITPSATPTLTPSPTPEPSFRLQAVTEADEPLAAADVQLVNETISVSATTDNEGLAVFEMVAVGNYTVTVTAVNYVEAITTIEIEDGTNELTISLTAGIFVQVIMDSSNLRAGPGTIYDSVGVVNEGDVLEVTGRSTDAEWLVVQTADNQQAWIGASLVEEIVAIEEIAIVSAPATPTAVPTTVAIAQPTSPPPAAPPSAAPPTGANLLVNPGFEAGETGWNGRGTSTSTALTPADGHANFVHSGAWSMLQFSGVYFQYVDGVTPGQTYRAGAWLKVWSSDGEDRLVSEDPGDFVARICINVDGDDDPSLTSNICSGFVRPLDVWQFIATDAVASTERITVILQVAFSGPTRARHNEAYWDDVTLGGSPIVATPTPVPIDPSVRPNPMPFDASALRDNMNNVRSILEQMGGLLDRLANGQTQTCLEYEDYYRRLSQGALYHSIPEGWQGVYNEYVFAIEHGLGTNDGIYSLCQNGGGSPTQQSYGTARQGINQSLDRLRPAIDTANSLLGG